MLNRGPRRYDLWAGSILGGIVNATMTAQSANFSPLCAWDGNHCFFNGMDGRDGVITFSGGHWYEPAPVVGVFYSVRYRAPDIETAREESALEPLFAGCPSYQRSLAEQAALPRLRFQYEGKLITHITTAIWDREAYIESAHPWQEFLRRGGDLIGLELKGASSAMLADWQLEYDMTAAQVHFAKSLLDRKLEDPARPIRLSRADAERLNSTSRDAEGLSLAREMFAKLDIVVP